MQETQSLLQREIELKKFLSNEHTQLLQSHEIKQNKLNQELQRIQQLETVNQENFQKHQL